MITVVMALYNGEKYIIEQLESLYKQSKKIDELIIIDDASTDNSFEIVKKYISNKKLKNWRLYKNNQNKGYIYTFKLAISKSTGDYIFLCDQDDIWKSNKIEEMYNIFSKNPKILSLCSSFEKIDTFGNPINIKKTRILTSNHGIIRKSIKKNAIKKINLNTILTFNISPGCTMAFKKEIKNEFLSSNVQIPHDWMINIISAISDGAYFYNKELILYRIHVNNTIGLGHKLTSVERLKTCQNEIIDRKNIYEYLDNNKDVKVKSKKYLSKIITLFNLRKNNLANHQIFKSILYTFLSVNKNGIIDNFLMDTYVLIKERKRKCY